MKSKDGGGIGGRKEQGGRGGEDVGRSGKGPNGGYPAASCREGTRKDCSKQSSDNLSNATDAL